MVSGNPRARSRKNPTKGTQAELAARAIQWSCLRYTASGKASYENKDVNFAGFPNTDCEAGFQSRIHFPSCWDGKNVDSSDHKSHVAFLSGMDNGKCPPTHPIRLMHLFYEVTWNVHSFAERWKESDGWPFVYSTGDPTGHSFHADFHNGWDVGVLQTAIDQCNNPKDDTINGVIEACRALTMIDGAKASQCKTPSIVKEPVPVNQKQLTKLPGCNPIQAGPGDSTMYTEANCPS